VTQKNGVHLQVPAYRVTVAHDLVRNDLDLWP